MSTTIEYDPAGLDAFLEGKPVISVASDAAKTAAKAEKYSVTKNTLLEAVQKLDSDIDLTDLHKEDGLFPKTHGKIDKRKGLAEFDEYLGELVGGRYGDKVNEVKQMAEQLDELKSLKEIAEKNGMPTKQADRDIAALQRKISTKSRGALMGVDKILKENQKVIGEASKEYYGLIKDIDREVDKVTKVRVAEVKAGNLTGADLSEAISEARREVKDVGEHVKDALKNAHQDRVSSATELAETIAGVTKDIEEVTGKSASEILGKAASKTHVDKLGDEASKAAKEGNAVLKFMKGNPIKTAVGAAVTGIVAASLLRGGNNRQEAAR